MWRELMGDETSKNRRKTYRTIGVLAILLILIPLGVYLVRQTQIFKPKAVDEQISPETSFTLSDGSEPCNSYQERPCPTRLYGIGQEFSVDVLVRSDFDPANVFNTNINFPKDLLEVASIYTGPIGDPPMCGTIAGLICPQGYTCQMEEPHYPDQGGICIPMYCGGFPGPDGNSPTCPQGYVCDFSDNDPQVADQSGICKLASSPSPSPQSCSGPTDNSCPSNYTCIENCGPPVSNDNDPSPGYSCLIAADVANRNLYGCPICLSKGTFIETPEGNVEVENLKEGMKVYSVDNSFKKVEAVVLKVSNTPVNSSHKMVNLILEDGREIWISPNHPTINNNQTVDQLKSGDIYDGSVVKSTTFVSYKAGFTYDLLPNTPSGFYFANGILMGSTLKSSVAGISTANAQTSCAQVITRACSNAATQQYPPGSPICQDFPTPCDVPEGWVVTNQGRTACNTDSDCTGGLTCQENLSGCFSQDGNTSCNAAKVCRKPENPSGYFITEWVQKTFDNNAGTIILNGKSRGTKTNLSGLTMATIKFKAKKAGTGTISFADSTQMLRLSDSLNILQTKRNLEFTVAGASPSPSPSAAASVSPSPSASARASCHGDSECSGNQYCQFVRRECSNEENCSAVMTGYCIANNGGKGDANNDGFIDLVDLSILYSNFLKNLPKLDFNNDRKINSLDYSNMVLLLRTLNIIK